MRYLGGTWTSSSELHSLPPLASIHTFWPIHSEKPEVDTRKRLWIAENWRDLSQCTTYGHEEQAERRFWSRHGSTRGKAEVLPNSCCFSLGEFLRSSSPMLCCKTQSGSGCSWPSWMAGIFGGLLGFGWIRVSVYTPLICSRLTLYYNRLQLVYTHCDTSILSGCYCSASGGCSHTLHPPGRKLSCF